MGWTNSSEKDGPIKPVKSGAGATQQIKKKYKIETKVLGSGAFGKVFLATSVADQNFKVAIKVISKKKLDQDIEQLIDEINILKGLDHPNIIKYYETYENNKYMYIVMEYCPGGELFDFIAQKGKDSEGTFKESEAAEIMKKLLKAINHCHSKKIAHRDIKPENIMMGVDGDIKLIDFGLSKQMKNKKMKTIVGTPYYIAPEVLEGKYNVKCDIWSLGVIMYILLSGYLPFGGNNAKEVFDKVKEGAPSFKQKEWKRVSPEAIDLIQHMLVVNTSKRYTAEQWLKHKWFDVAKGMIDDDFDSLDPQMLKNLTEFKGASALKKAAMNLLVKTLNPKEIQNLREQFELLDTDQTGTLDAMELTKALKKANMHISDKEVENIIKEIDYEGNGEINYSEFIAATLSIHKLLNENRLIMLFKEFDIDDTGFITKDNLIQAFDKLERDVSKKEIDQIIKDHDFEKNGKISFEEFRVMMVGENDDIIDYKI